MAAAKKADKVSAKKKAKQSPDKLKKAAKKVVAKHARTAKKGIRKLVKKAVAKSSKVTKKAVRKHSVTSGAGKKATLRAKTQTKAIMKPFGDMAIAVIDVMDNAMHSAMGLTSKNRKK